MEHTDPFNILIPVRLEDVDTIWITLRNRRFEFGERPHAHFSARRHGLHVTVYEKGPKVLVQGKGVREFVESVLGPMVGDGAAEIELRP